MACILASIRDKLGKQCDYHRMIKEYSNSVADVPKDFSEYIPMLLREQAKAKIFLDFTFNPDSNIRMSQGSSSIYEIFDFMANPKNHQKDTGEAICQREFLTLCQMDVFVVV